MSTKQVISHSQPKTQDQGSWAAVVIIVVVVIVVVVINLTE